MGVEKIVLHLAMHNEHLDKAFLSRDKGVGAWTRASQPISKSNSNSPFGIKFGVRRLQCLECVGRRLRRVGHQHAVEGGALGIAHAFGHPG